jgi:hypothetical protein
MLTQTRTTKAGTIEREIRLSRDTQGRLWAAVTETKHLKTKANVSLDLYDLTPIAADFGVGIRVDKTTGAGESYDVNLSEALGDSCSCPAGSYRGECRHIQLAREAKRLGLL